MFCYGFYPATRGVGGYAHPRATPNRKRGPGTGEQYRITAPGPGVTPDVMWQGAGLHPYDKRNPADVSLEQPDERRARHDPRRLTQVPQH